MLTRRIIPCLDVRDGRVVKGVRFANLRDAGDPVAQATAYEAQGADELVILDVSATIEARETALQTVRDVRAALSIPLTVGGGVRATRDALALLDAGADKVAMNTAAVLRPEIVRELAEQVGAQCVVLAIDAARCQTTKQEECDAGQRGKPGLVGSRGDGGGGGRGRGGCGGWLGVGGVGGVGGEWGVGRVGGWEVVTCAGTNRTGIDVIEWASHGSALGAGEILLTSWDRDGTRDGYDIDLLRAVTSAVPVPVIASGGADTSNHMLSAFQAGADAVLAASIFHDADTTVDRIKAQLAESGVEVRR